MLQSGKSRQWVCSEGSGLWKAEVINHDFAGEIVNKRFELFKLSGVRLELEVPSKSGHLIEELVPFRCAQRGNGSANEVESNSTDSQLVPIRGDGTGQTRVGVVDHHDSSQLFGPLFES